MTYLEIVNEVLTRLRERSVSTVPQKTYSTMVGAFVNDAKRQIEQAWDWNANRSIVTVTTSDGTGTYALTGFGQQGKVLSAWNDTDNFELQRRSQPWFDRMNYTQTSVEGSPRYWGFRGEDASDDSQVELWYVPDGVYNLRFNCVIPQADLSADGDVIQIPWRPVVLLAVAMLAEEKGETGGVNSKRYFEMADKELSNAIAFDAGKYPTENVWFEV